MNRHLFFLKFGYFPKAIEPTIINRRSDFDFHSSLRAMSEKGVELFMSGVESEFELDSHHVIPLSGGLDSRAILAALLKFTDAKNIYAYSYGSKGTFDYEIGRLIASEIGVNHVSFDMQGYNFSLEDLSYHAKSVGGQTVLFHTPPTKQIDSMFGGACLWSGIVGDVVAGSAIPEKPSADIGLAIEKYLSTKVYSDHKDGVDYRQLKKSITTFFPPNRSTWTISFDEQVILSERYEKFYKPVILHIEEACFKQPFVNNSFMDFMLSAPLEVRQNKVLYQQILKDLDSRLFSFPTKQNLGAGLFSGKYEMLFRRAINRLKSYNTSAIDRSTNYFEFHRKFSVDQAFRLMISDLVKSFSARLILDKSLVGAAFLSFEEKGVNEPLIKAMVSLEVHLQNGESGE